ncbi:MAG: hypothetical protein M1824_001399 [Vezdaea acicularis]|nr:MAG: hypothetical protein M1824_001399 [Vezdaea acicularis]
MHIPLSKRNTHEATPDPSVPTGTGGNTIIIVIAILCSVSALIITYVVLRIIRIKHKSPRYVPTAFLKHRWEKWKPSSGHSYENIDPQTAAGRASSDVTLEIRQRNSSNPASASNNTNGSANVDRNTSVRSVQTLPPYKFEPSEHERVLGRAGERGGIDVVVEFPEPEEALEARRDGEMEALYQIRLARRREAAEREERRRRRRIAREAGDTATLEQLRLEREARRRAASLASGGVGTPMESSTSLSTAIMQAELASRDRERERRVSSVSYADVGLARHDGTRVRQSEDDDNRPLLETTSTRSSGGTRNRSGSALSVSTLASEDQSPPATGRSAERDRADSAASSFRAPHSRQSSQGGPAASRDLTPILTSVSASSATSVQHPPLPEVDGEDFVGEPPRYDEIRRGESTRRSPAARAALVEDRGEVPPYESPVEDGVPRLPAMGRLPAIEVTASSPAVSREGTLVGRR